MHEQTPPPPVNKRHLGGLSRGARPDLVIMITAADMSGTPGEGLIVLQDQRRAHQQILQRVAMVTYYNHLKPLRCLKGGPI